MELLETPMGEAEIMSRETAGDGRDWEIILEPDLEIPVIPEDPKEYMKEYRRRSIMKTRRCRPQHKRC